LPNDPKELPKPDSEHQPLAPHSEQHKGHLVRILVWLVILLVFALAFYWVLNRHEAQKATGGGRRGLQGAVPVVPATAKQGNIGVYQEAIGTVTPVYTASISSQVNGIVTGV
jgi:membrane fusion protein, multidrug efflux system